MLDEPLGGARGPGHAEPPRLPVPKKFAPRPTYEHRAIVDRADDDFDDLEFKQGALPVDRLFEPRETFEGFVDQGSYQIHWHARAVPSRNADLSESYIALREYADAL